MGNQIAGIIKFGGMQKICVIIPCYNEEIRFPKKEFLDFLSSDTNIHFCLVNDGSKDQTIKLLNELQQHAPERIKVIDLPKNGGKAEAVRQGILQANAWKSFTALAYFDADFSAPLSQLFLLLEAFKKNSNSFFVFGSRVKRMGAIIHRSPKRHYLGRIFSTFASMMLKLPVYDTQCGAKLISSSEVNDIFAAPFISRWLFDIEIMARFIKKYGKDKCLQGFVEVPLEHWEEVGDSRIKSSHLVKIPLELLRIKRRYEL